MNEESKQIIAEIQEVEKLLNNKIEEVRTELKEEMKELKGEMEEVKQRLDKVEEKIEILSDDIEYVKIKTDVIASTAKLHDTEINRLKFDVSRLKKAE